MAPKLLNRFRVKVKTENPDENSAPPSTAAADPAAPAGAAPSGVLAAMAALDDDAPLSSFQVDRMLLQGRASASGNGNGAADASSSAAVAAAARARGAAPLPGAGAPMSARDRARAAQTAAATVHAAAAQQAAASAGMGGGGSMAAVKLEELQRQSQRYTQLADAIIPPINSQSMPATPPAGVEGASVKLETQDDAAPLGSRDADDDVLDARRPFVPPPTNLEPGLAFLGAADREDHRRAVSNLAFFLDEKGQAQTFERPTLAWMQLPRLPAAPALGRALPEQASRELLDGVPPGRVGRLRVHRSGRVTLVLDCLPAHGAPPVPLDVSVAGQQSGEAAPSQNLMLIDTAGGLGGMDMVRDELRCYDLGQVTHKLVCVPDLAATDFS